ncbi:RNA polymerase II transcription factor B 52 kDa subunit [Fusarium falciforme]|nr:RNA polymerase II transcription factor B 52 kDa subunit [Fusarium falciforme]
MSVSPAPSLQLAEYLEKLPGTTFRKLYQQPSTAFAIFRRMLPHLAKTFVMRILYSPKPILLTDLDDWVKPSAKRQKDQALSILRVLYIVQITAPSKERPQEMQLTANFKTSLRLALSGGGTHNSFGVPSNLQVPPRSTSPSSTATLGGNGRIFCTLSCPVSGTRARVTFPDLIRV